MTLRKSFDSQGLGRRLRDAREAAGVLQTDAAKRLDVSQPTLSRWESGETVPDVGDIMEMCRIYKASLSGLVIGPDARTPAEIQIEQIRAILGPATPRAASPVEGHVLEEAVDRAVMSAAPKRPRRAE